MRARGIREGLHVFTARHTLRGPDGLHLSLLWITFDTRTTHSVAENALHDPRKGAQLEHPGAPKVRHLIRRLHHTAEHHHKRKECREQNRGNHGVRTHGGHGLRKSTVVNLE